LVLLFAFVNPPKGFYMASEARRLGSVEQNWTKIDDFPPYMARSVVAAEDANFCLHRGLDFDAIRLALEEDRNRGASTISQQVAKNVFLWHGRNWTRKGLEVMFTFLVELFWTKERIVEVYLNVAEFDEGVFGAGAAARHYFGVSAGELTKLQAARLAAILPSPQRWSASKPTNYIRKRTRRILSGAATIAAEGRSDCF
jgi:monofunctional biosynthetic peptidoglycan transglycosylase